MADYEVAKVITDVNELNEEAIEELSNGKEDEDNE